MASSVRASGRAGSARYAASTAATFRSPSSHGVSTGRKTSSRVRGTSCQRDGRFTYMVIAYRFTQRRFSARSRIRSSRARYAPDCTRFQMSEPVGALVSKSRSITASNCSSVSNTPKSSSGKKFDGKTRRPRRFTTKGFIEARPSPARGRARQVVFRRTSKTAATKSGSRAGRSWVTLPEHVRTLFRRSRLRGSRELLGLRGARSLVAPCVSDRPHAPRPARRVRERAHREGDAPLREAILRPFHDADRRPRRRGARDGSPRHSLLQSGPLRARCGARRPEGPDRRAALGTPRLAPARYGRPAPARARSLHHRLDRRAARPSLRGTV